MKTAFSSAEPLEPRIAPARLVNASVVEWTDLDGDRARLEFSKPILTSNTLANQILQFHTGLVDGLTSTGQELLRIDLFPLAFAGIDGDELHITVKRLPGLQGDGKVNVGYIRAGEPFQNSPNQFSPLFDLGIVKIQGDLTAVDAGDAFSDFAIRELRVDSMGVFKANDPRQTAVGSTIPDVVSDLFGPVGKIVIKGDLASSVIRVFGAQFGDIGLLKIGGALGGPNNLVDANDASIAGNTGGGAVLFTGSLRKADVGTFSGEVANSAIIRFAGSFTSLETTGDIGSITVRGDLAGEGTRSGEIVATSIGKLKVEGSILGGSGSRSGHVNVTGTIGKANIVGDLDGGAGSSSGSIDAAKIAKAKIGGSLLGAGTRSGTLDVDALGTIKIAGSLKGGTGTESGAILGKTAKSLSVTGSLEGGQGQTSGAISISGKADKISVGGDLIGGTGDLTGAIRIGGRLAELQINGSIVGSDIAADGDSNGITRSRSGYVAALSLGKMTLGGSLVAGNNAEPIENTMNSVGAIRVERNIGTLSIRGGLYGDFQSFSGKQITISYDDSPAPPPPRNYTYTFDGSGVLANPAIISAGGNPDSGKPAIKKLVVEGSALGGLILAGVNAGNSAVNPDASIGKIIIGQDIRATSIAAGVTAGDDGSFGTADDTPIPGDTTPKLLSRIASVVVRGNFLDSNVQLFRADPILQPGDTPVPPAPFATHFGIVAGRIDSVAIPNAPVSLGPIGNEVSQIGLQFAVREVS